MPFKALQDGDPVYPEQIKRPPDGTITFVLKDIERGDADGVTVASTNLYPERLIKATRQIASVIEDS